VKKQQSPEIKRLPLAEGDAGYILVQSPEPDGRKAIIGHGFMSTPEHYLGMAETLARTGCDVGLVDYGEPLKDESDELPSVYKWRRMCMTMEAMGDADSWIAAAHSYGGVPLARLLRDAPVSVDLALFLSSLGFGEPQKVNPSRFPDVMRMYGSELIAAVLHPRHIINPSAVKGQVGALVHRTQRIRELEEITSLECDFSVEPIKRAKVVGVKVLVAVAPRDHVVPPHSAVESMEGDVVEIHPKADHFAPITHGNHVAKLAA